MCFVRLCFFWKLRAFKVIPLSLALYFCNHTSEFILPYVNQLFTSPSFDCKLLGRQGPALYHPTSQCLSHCFAKLKYFPNKLKHLLKLLLSYLASFYVQWTFSYYWPATVFLFFPVLLLLFGYLLFPCGLYASWEGHPFVSF